MLCCPRRFERRQDLERYLGRRSGQPSYAGARGDVTREVWGTGDFVGCGDCDLVCGPFKEFIDDVHAVGGDHGHFTAVRNTAAMRRLLLEVPDLAACGIDPRLFGGRPGQTKSRVNRR